jgi:hypothetical protein
MRTDFRVDRAALLRGQADPQVRPTGRTEVVYENHDRTQLCIHTRSGLNRGRSRAFAGACDLAWVLVQGDTVEPAECYDFNFCGKSAGTPRPNANGFNRVSTQNS